MGKHILCCGHEKLTDRDGEELVLVGEWGCDAIDGFYPSVAYRFPCEACAADMKTWDEYLPDDAAAEAHLDRTDGGYIEGGNDQT